MANVTLHGGQCCGVRHAYAFELGYPEREQIRMHNLIESKLIMGMLVEVVLTDDQIDPANDIWDGNSKRIRETLRKFKFKKVTRFRNGNSGNYCNVYHAHKKRERLTRGA